MIMQHYERESLVDIIISWAVLGAVCAVYILIKMGMITPTIHDGSVEMTPSLKESDVEYLR
jgi:hypothetical protein